MLMLSYLLMILPRSINVTAPRDHDRELMTGNIKYNTTISFHDKTNTEFTFKVFIDNGNMCSTGINGFFLSICEIKKSQNY